LKQDLIQKSAMLLEHCSGTIKKFEEFYSQSGQKYNIFKIADINNDEVKTCKVLTDLLSVNGKHCKGDLFLRQFIEIVNKETQSPFVVDTKKARVKNEYSTDIGRRIDIVIEDGNIFIPIEVKIFAGDQDKQVSHYAEFSRLRNKNKNIPVIYLTIEGHPPSNASKGEYITISWKEHILKWLNICLRNTEVEKSKPVFEVLKQLILSIKSFCGVSEDEKMENAIQSLVTQSDDNLKAAMAVKHAVDALIIEADDNSWKLFSTKILSQIQKTVPDAECPEPIEDWYYMNIPIRNGRYYFELNYNWGKLCIQRSESNTKGDLKEERALHKKMTDLTGIPSKDWEGFIWVSDKFTYPRFLNIEPELYSYELNKEYSGNMTEVVKLILNYINELNKA